MSIRMMCNEGDPGAYLVENYPGANGPLWMREFAVGEVLALRERNGYDDSDFLALVGDPKTGEASWVEYATTRGWTYPNSATVDATPELIEAYKANCKAKSEAFAAKLAAVRSCDAKFGTVVVVKAARGKAAALNGTEGEVCWEGPGFGYGSPARLGLRLLDGSKVFVNATQVQVKGATAEFGGKPVESVAEARKALSMMRGLASYGVAALMSARWPRAWT